MGAPSSTWLLNLLCCADSHRDACGRGRRDLDPDVSSALVGGQELIGALGGARDWTAGIRSRVHSSTIRSAAVPLVCIGQFWGARPGALRCSKTLAHLHGAPNGRRRAGLTYRGGADHRGGVGERDELPPITGAASAHAQELPLVGGDGRVGEFCCTANC